MDNNQDRDGAGKTGSEADRNGAGKTGSEADRNGDNQTDQNQKGTDERESGAGSEKKQD